MDGRRLGADRELRGADCWQPARRAAGGFGEQFKRFAVVVTRTRR